MKSSIKSLAACLGLGAALVSASAYAEGFYAELGYASVKVELSAMGASASGTPSDAVLHVGYMFTKNFGAEILGTTSVSDAGVGGGKVKLDSAYGAYLKGQIEVAPSFELFARIGYVNGTIALSGGGQSASTSDGAFSYAAGLQYAFTKNWYVQVDYAQYYNKTASAAGLGSASITARGPSISVGYRF